jgi:hypothetical protein
MKTQITTTGKISPQEAEAFSELTEMVLEEFAEKHPKAGIKSFDMNFIESPDRRGGVYQYAIEAERE